MMAGNLVSLFSPLIIIAICQLIGGNSHYDFNELKNMEQLRELPPDTNGAELEKMHEAEAREKQNHDNELTVTMSHAQVAAYEKHEQEFAEGERILNKSALIARVAAICISLSVLIIWPMPMYGTGYIFSKEFFTGWICVAFIWLFISLLVVVVWPVWQGRYPIAHTVRGIYWDLTGQSHKLRDWQEEHPEDLHVAFSPVASAISPVASPIMGIEAPQDAPPLVKRD